MQTSVSIIAETPTGSSVPRSKAALHSSKSYALRLGIRPETIAVVEKLDRQTEHFYTLLCFFDEPSRQWLALPRNLQQQIDKGLWSQEISELQVAFLLIVAEVRP